MSCKACAERIKNWKGSDPKCGFVTGPFTAENWNCALTNQIRELAERENVYGIHHHCPENQHFATICTLEFNVLPEEDERGTMNAQPVCLWVGWYKSRGRTEAMWLMFENTPPRQPTEAECLVILEHYKEKK